MRIHNAAADYYINSNSTSSIALDVLKHKTSGIALVEVGQPTKLSFCSLKES